MKERQARQKIEHLYEKEKARTNMGPEETEEKHMSDLE